MNYSNWYEERIARVTLQRSFLLLFAASLLIALFVALFTLFAVTKSRSIEPFVVEVSKSTGVVNLVNPATTKEYSANRAITNSLLVRYVRSRESFNPATYRYDYYTTVRVLSDPELYSRFRYFLRLSNPQSPLNAYSRVVNSDFSVRSIQHLDDNSALVGFTLLMTNKDGMTAKLNKVATVGFVYSSLTMTEEDRYANPLGFVVSSYQVEDDQV